MKIKLHKLSEGFIITSDEKIEDEEIHYCSKYNELHSHKFRNNEHTCLKIIAQQDQITFSEDIPEEKLKEIGWFDIDKKATYASAGFSIDVQTSSFQRGYKFGFREAQKLLSDRKYTEEDLMNFYKHVKTHTVAESLAHISKTSWEIEVEMEEYSGYDFTGMPCVGMLRPKFIEDKLKITKIS